MRVGACRCGRWAVWALHPGHDWMARAANPEHMRNEHKTNHNTAACVSITPTQHR